VTVGENLVERIPLEDTADVEVSEVPDRNEGRGVAPCTMFYGQRPNIRLDVLEEFVKMRCISTLCGEGEVLQVGKLGQDELSSPIGGPDYNCESPNTDRDIPLIRSITRTIWDNGDEASSGFAEDPFIAS